MKLLFHFRRASAALHRLNAARKAAIKASVPPSDRARLRYVPLQMGGQILPFIVDTGSTDRRRDPYD